MKEKNGQDVCLALLAVKQPHRGVFVVRDIRLRLVSRRAG